MLHEKWKNPAPKALSVRITPGTVLKRCNGVGAGGDGRRAKKGKHERAERDDYNSLAYTNLELENMQWQTRRNCLYKSRIMHNSSKNLIKFAKFFTILTILTSQ